MGLRNIVKIGDPILRKTARPVDEITPRITKLLDDLAETMHDGGQGIGLAAPQVGVSRRVFVVDLQDETGLLEFINPEIISQEGEQICQEGCLSVPGKVADVKRPARITVKALNRNGEEFTLEADGLLANCICHEYDHLDGILYVDKAIDGKVYDIDAD